MNNVIDLIMKHRTIREFENRAVPKGNLDLLLDALMRTPTSSGLQQASIIRVTDKERKEEIARVCNQDYVARTPELLIFVLDIFRNKNLVKDSGEALEDSSDVDLFFQGYTDACIMAQNALMIVESMGMGGVYLGSILNNPKRIIEILDLPNGVFPVVGLGFGFPKQNPQLKPRMDKSFRVFENSYKILDNYKEALEDYDQEMTTYYDLRDANNRVDSFSVQVTKKLKNKNPLRLKLLDFARENKINL